MNYRNSTPFKLKGSPFKQTGKTDVGNGNDPTMVKDVFTQHNKNKLIGNSNDEIIAIAPTVETENVDLQTSGNSINEDGTISRSIESQKGTITTSNQQSSGDILKAPSADGSTQYKGSDFIGDVLMKSKRFKGLSGKALVDAGHISKDKADEWNKRTNYSAPKNNNNSNVSTDLDTNQQKGQMGVYDYGTKQSSYESRKNMRTTKHNTNTVKNREIANARLKWKGMSEKEREAAGGSRRDFMKNVKIESKTKRNDAIIKKGESESRNSQRASDQNIGLGGKVRGNKRNVTSYDSAETIKGAQNSMDLSLSGGINTISQQIEKNKNIGKGPSFRMGGYGSKNK
jgi:hypothetical protein